MHPDMQACRRRHVPTIRSAIRRAIETGDELARLMETYFELATGAGIGYLAWTELLPPQLLEALEQARSKMKSERGRFVKYGTLFANTARELYAIRQGLLAGLPPWRSPRRLSILGMGRYCLKLLVTYPCWWYPR